MDWQEIAIKLVRNLPWAVGANLVLSVAAFLLKTVTAFGAFVGAAIGMVVFLSLGWQGFVVLGLFFALGSAASKAGYKVKDALGAAQEKGGARSASHALANCGAGATCAVLALLLGGKGGAGFRLAFVASFAAAAADTTATEVGTALSKRAILLSRLKKTAPGTPGAISIAGTVAAFWGALVVGCAGWAVGLVDLQGATVVTIAGLVASILESLLGGSARARRVLGHHGRNFVNTAVGALLALLWVGLVPL